CDGVWRRIAREPDMSTPPSYGVTWQDVRLPLDMDAIPATGGRISRADLAAYIEAGGVEVTGLMQRAGIDPTSLTTLQLIQVQKDIIPYAQHMALAQIGNSGPAYTQALARWQAVVTKWASSSSLTPGAATTALNNLPEEAFDIDARSPWTGRGFRF